MQATRAPKALPSWIAIVPMPLLPPCTSSVSPAASPASWKTLAYTVQAVSGNAAASVTLHPRGQRQHLPRRHHHLLGVTAAGQQRAHLVTRPPVRDAVADGADPARALQARVRRRARRRRVEALPLHQVRAVDPAGGDVDDHLARAGDRVGHLEPVQHLGFAGFGDDDSVHSFSFVRCRVERDRRANSVISGLSARQGACIATECHHSGALGIEIARHLAYARRDVRTRPACAPAPMRTKRDDPVTMNNDTPQVFGEDTHDYPHDPAPLPDQDGEDFPPFRGWAGWGERVEPVAPDDDYPQPSFYPYEPASRELEYPGRPSQGRPGYPQGPGYAPDAETGIPHTRDSPRTRATRETRASTRTWSRCR